MAERKKVQQIKTKRTSNKPKKAVNKTNLVNQKTQPIKMTSKNEKPVKKFENKADVKKTVKSVRQSQPKTVRNNETNRNRKKPLTFSVIRGNKGEVEKKKLISICVSLVLILSVLIFFLTSPTGPVERITNAFEIMGGGNFPATLTGTKLLSFNTVDNKAFALTNSHLCGYTFSGKNFIQLQHGFSNPVLDLSKERALVYNRESNKILIANNSGLVFEQNLEKPVYCADISYNGSVAFACESASYSAQVLVFDKNMKQYYTWYLADGLISDIALSNNGKYVAVAVLKVKNGAFYSQIYCLDTDEKDPIYTKELADETVFKIESTSGSDFVYSSNKKVSFVKWKTGEIINTNGFGAPTYFNKVSKYYLALYGEANHSDIVLYNSSGEIKHQFEHNGIIDDISVFDDTVYILSSNKITCFDFKKTTEKTITLDNNVNNVLGVDGGALVVNNTTINFVPSDVNK